MRYIITHREQQKPALSLNDPAVKVAIQRYVALRYLLSFKEVDIREKTQKEERKKVSRAVSNIPEIELLEDMLRALGKLSEESKGKSPRRSIFNGYNMLYDSFFWRYGEGLKDNTAIWMVQHPERYLAKARKEMHTMFLGVAGSVKWHIYTHPRRRLIASKRSATYEQSLPTQDGKAPIGNSEIIVFLRTNDARAPTTSSTVANDNALVNESTITGLGRSIMKSSRRIAIWVLVGVFAFSICASIYAFRSKIWRFLDNRDHEYSSVMSNLAPISSAEDEGPYRLLYVPAGFTLKRAETRDTYTVCEYTDGGEGYIVFRQRKTYNFSPSITEWLEEEVIILQTKKTRALLFKSKEYLALSWQDNEYYFYLEGDVSLDDLMKIANHILP